MGRVWPCLLRRPHDLISVPQVDVLPRVRQPGFLHGDPRPWLPSTLAALKAGGAGTPLPFTADCDLLLSPAPAPGPGHELEMLIRQLDGLPRGLPVALYERDRPLWPNLLVAGDSEAAHGGDEGAVGLRAYRSAFRHRGAGGAEALVVLPALRMKRLLRGSWLAALPGGGALANRRFLHTALDHERTLAECARRPGAATVPGARRVLVLMPHFDDEALQCGGAILQARAAGAEVRLVWMTDGARGIADVEPEESTRRRKEEARAAAALLGVDDLHFLDAPETRLEAGGPWTDRLRRLLEEFSPERVHLTWWADNHVDHYESNRVARAAWPAAMLGVPVCASGAWSPLPAGADLPLDEATVHGRDAALAAHASQLQAVDYLRAVRGLSTWYARGGAQPSCPEAQAERYWVLPADDYWAAFRASGADRRRWRG